MAASDMRTRISLAALAAVAFPPVAHSAHWNIGREVTQQELAAWDITVFADGSGYPAGKGSVARGAEVYQTTCAGCHGARLEGGLGPALAGGKGTLASAKPLKTVGSYWPYASTLFDYVRRAMPFQAPGSLTNDDVYSVAGYVLHANGLLPADSEVDASVLRNVRMPNRDGFYVDNRPDVKNPRCMRHCPTK